MTDTQIVRDLAKQYMEAAMQPSQEEKAARMRRVNNLGIARPPVLIDEIPWHELNAQGELTLRCADPLARDMEDWFRKALYQQAHFPCDRIFERAYPLSKRFTSSGIGLDTEETRVRTDDQNAIVSHAYHDLLPDEAALEKVHDPVITVYPEDDQRRLAKAQELLGDVMPVVLRGVTLYIQPWDEIPRYHGVENTLLDLIERPEFMHRVMAVFTKGFQSLMDQYERLGLLDPNGPLLHCTPAQVDGVPREDNPDGPYRLKDMWFRSMA